MTWGDQLLPEQRSAASHAGSHARLLAGPGTGKTLTLTRHICYLVLDKELSPESILAITFTRAAARELRQRVAAALGENQSPRISTLHSFALRQLLKNATIINDLPQPLRIADDWEEHNIVLPDLKDLSKLQRTSDAQDLLNQLSADWQSLTADESDWDEKFPDPGFLGSWQQHRSIYGYTLRAELVYQLKRTLEQRGDFELESPIEHLVIDEYQDLNRCDLAVVNQIATRGTELFVAGDDDQSIYGFRKADPEGIRRFNKDYSTATNLELSVCKRCDKQILDLGLFVARQDPRRIEKDIKPEPDRSDGEVALLRFRDQDEEAAGIADVCRGLINNHGLEPGKILILLRSDRHAAFSKLIRQALEGIGIPVASGIGVTNPLAEDAGRAFLAFMRIAVQREDGLAWRTLLKVWCEGVGDKSISAIYNLAYERGETFAQTLLAAQTDKDILPSAHRSRIYNATKDVLGKLNAMFPKNIDLEYSSQEELHQLIRDASSHIDFKDETRGAVLSEITQSSGRLEKFSIPELLRTVGTAGDEIEQELDEDKVNILTMHRAKGLTREAVIVAAAEDQYIPGNNIGIQEEDERRLLYVSLTRARHHLFVTYCDRRTGRQSHTGRDRGKTARSLTRFLAGSPYSPKNGQDFASDYGRRVEE